MKKRWKFVSLLLVILLIGFLLPERLVIPVAGATSADWNANSFWHYPWGKSVTHKGIDIFANEGVPVIAATDGVVVFAGERGMGGKIVLALGPRWRFHYFAHLNAVDVKAGDWLTSGERIGTVGTTGNAAGKPPHLHYTIATPIPNPWQASLDEKQGLRKMFFIDPNDALTR